MVKTVKKIPSPDLTTKISPELIGKAIRARRTQSQLRLEDAAALCRVAKQTLMQVEHGYPTTQISTVLQICSALGIHIVIQPWQEENEADHEWL